MIDFRVAADKIAQFQTAEEIAGYLGEQGVRAIPECGTDCAIARYMQDATGVKNVFVGTAQIFLNPPMDTECVVDIDAAEDTYDHTPAMRDFVTRYDMGAYPELVEVRSEDAPQTTDLLAM